VLEGTGVVVTGTVLVERIVVEDKVVGLPVVVSFGFGVATVVTLESSESPTENPIRRRIRKQTNLRSIIERS
jgi:hypothetical protein